MAVNEQSRSLPLTPLLRDSMVSWEALEERYGPLLKLVDMVLGVVPSPGKAGALLDPAAPSRPAPPVDGLRTKLRLLPLLPAAIRTDRKWQRGVPGRWPDAGAFLYERTGHDFPVLERLHSNRVRRSITSMLTTNLDPALSAVGIDTKILAGAVFAEIVADGHLAEDIRALASHAGIGADRLAKTTAFARGDDTAFPADHPSGAALILARAASYSPARVDSTTIAACSRGELSAAAIIEMITWLAVLQMLHRLTCFTAIAD